MGAIWMRNLDEEDGSSPGFILWKGDFAPAICTETTELFNVHASFSSLQTAILPVLFL